MLTGRPRGTNDILPDDISKWYKLEKVMRSVGEQYGYREVRTPIFEHTELFQRGVGETTDIVEKEMYTFLDRGGRSLTLRPEGTASTVRAFIEHKLFAGALPVKLFYMGPMFRYDRPQAGRYRQFHQFGVEVLGSNDPSLDAEVIALTIDIYHRLGLKDLIVELNSVGCPKCRPVHRDKLQEFLSEKKEQLCSTCRQRYEKNPLRILDCKNEKCQEIVKNAPTIDQMLCEDCHTHFQKVQEYLKALGVSYRLNPRMVRGLDYYVQTAFEIVARGIGAQSSIGGGGRYDGLVEECGGPATPGIGFAMGLERILLALEQQGVALEDEFGVDVYIASMGEQARLKAFTLAQSLRKKGLIVERDYLDKSLKSQLKSADRYGVSIALIIGDEEVEKNQVLVRKMNASEQELVSSDDIEKYLFKELGKEAI